MHILLYFSALATLGRGEYGFVANLADKLQLHYIGAVLFCLTAITAAAYVSSSFLLLNTVEYVYRNKFFLLYF